MTAREYLYRVCNTVATHAVRELLGRLECDTGIHAKQRVSPCSDEAFADYTLTNELMDYVIERSGLYPYIRSAVHEIQ